MERTALLPGGGEGKGHHPGIRLGWGSVCKSVGDGLSRTLGLPESLALKGLLEGVEDDGRGQCVVRIVGTPELCLFGSKTRGPTGSPQDVV